MQVDRKTGLAADVAIKAPVAVATTANITLSGAQTIDAVSIVADDRVLVKDQTDASENGIYIASASGWSRAPDFNQDNDIVKGSQCFVNGGTVSAGMTGVISSSDPIDLGTDNITFSMTLIVDATIAADLATLAPISADITTAAGISSDITAVAAIAADVSSGAALNFRFTFSDTTSMADPAGGNVRFNHATIASVTALAFADVSADTGNPDISDFIATLDDVTNAVASARIIARKVGTPAFFAIFKVTGAVTDNTDWLQVAVTYEDGNLALTDADNLVFSFHHSGEDGAGSGDMLIATYDPGAVGGDAFDMDNMVEGADTKIPTADEMTVLGNTSNTNSGDEATASTTVSGISESATAAEVNTGTDAVRHVTPSSFAGSTKMTEQADSVWEAGTSETPSVVSPDAVKDAIAALAGGGGQPIPTSSSYAVDTLLLCLSQIPTAIADGASTAGSNLTIVSFDSAGDVYTSGNALSGTWKNVSGESIDGDGAIPSGYFVRTA